MMCAAVASARGRRVLILEKNSKVGRKILISGGGRCNFTNRTVGPENFYSENLHFSRSALNRYSPQSFIDLVDSHRIAYHEKTLGQLFCDHSSRQIVALLLDECARGNVTIECNADIVEVSGHGPFQIATHEHTYAAESLVIATGGLSIPKIGATDFGHRIARQYGLKMTECRPALVPLTVQSPEFEPFKSLRGTSVRASVRCGDAEFLENILFTHWGLSGPAILQISLYWTPGKAIDIDLYPEGCAREWLEDMKRSQPRLTMVGALKTILPSRLAKTFGDVVCPTGTKPLAELPGVTIKKMANALNQWTIHPSGTQGLQESRSHSRWCVHSGHLFENHGSKLRPGTVFHRGSRGRHGLAWWIQFPMGLGIRNSCRPNRLDLLRTRTGPRKKSAPPENRKDCDKVSSDRSRTLLTW